MPKKLIIVMSIKVPAVENCSLQQVLCFMEGSYKDIQKR